MRYFNYQFKKALFSIEFVFPFAVILFCYCFTGMSVIKFQNDFLSDFVGIVSNTLPALIFPMLVCMPAAVSYVAEYESGYLNILLSKMSLRRYIITKLFTNAVIGGLVVSLPPAFYLLRILEKKGTSVGTSENATWPIDFYPDLYETHPLLYAGIIIAFIFLCGMVFATLGIGIGAILKKKYLVILVPEIYYIGVAVIVQNMRLCRYLDPTTLYVLNSFEPLKLSLRFIYAMVIFIVGAALFVLGVRKNAE